MLPSSIWWAFLCTNVFFKCIFDILVKAALRGILLVRWNICTQFDNEIPDVICRRFVFDLHLPSTLVFFCNGSGGKAPRGHPSFSTRRSTTNVACAWRHLVKMSAPTKRFHVTVFRRCVESHPKSRLPGCRFSKPTMPRHGQILD